MVDTLGEYIENEMQRRGMTLREFAEFTKVSHPTLSRIVNDVNYAPLIKRATIEKLAEALGVNPKVLERLAKKDLLVDDEADVRAMVELIRSLPQHQREAVDALLAGFKRKGE